MKTKPSKNIQQFIQSEKITIQNIFHERKTKTTSPLKNSIPYQTLIRISSEILPYLIPNSILVQIKRLVYQKTGLR